MTCILDTNVAFEVIFNRPQANRYREILSSADKVLVPEIFVSEATNVMWQYMKAGIVDEENAKLSLAIMFQLADSIEPAGNYAMETLHESFRLQHPAYDMFYLCLARHHAATLLTLDQKLIATCHANGVDTI